MDGPNYAVKITILLEAS